MSHSESPTDHNMGDDTPRPIATRPARSEHRANTSTYAIGPGQRMLTYAEHEATEPIHHDSTMTESEDDHDSQVYSVPPDLLPHHIDLPPSSRSSRASSAVSVRTRRADRLPRASVRAARGLPEPAYRAPLRSPRRIEFLSDADRTKAIEDIVHAGAIELDKTKAEIDTMMKELQEQRAALEKTYQEVRQMADEAKRHEAALRVTWESAKETQGDLERVKTVVETELGVIKSTTEEQGSRLGNLTVQIRDALQKHWADSQAESEKKFEELVEAVRVELHAEAAIRKSDDFHISNRINKVADECSVALRRQKESQFQHATKYENSLAAQKFNCIGNHDKASTRHKKLKAIIAELAEQVAHGHSDDVDSEPDHAARNTTNPTPIIPLAPLSPHTPIPATVSMPIRQAAYNEIPNVPLPPIQAPVAAMPYFPSTLKAREPKLFDGTASKLRTFTNQLDVYFRMQPHAFEGKDEVKILYATSLMTDAAASWWDANQMRLNIEWKEYSRFLHDFVSDFADSSEIESTKHTLLQRFQKKGESIIEYLADIRSMNNIVRLPHERIYEHLKDSVLEEVRKELRRTDPSGYFKSPDNEQRVYQKIKACGQAVEQDKKLETVIQAKRALAKMHDERGKGTDGKDHGKSEKKKETRTDPKAGRITKRSDKRSKGKRGTPTTTSTSPATTLNATTVEKKRVSQPIIDGRKAANQCWNCGKTGHISRDCTSPTVYYDTNKKRTGTTVTRKVASAKVVEEAVPTTTVNHGRIWSLSDDEGSANSMDCQ